MTPKEKAQELYYKYFSMIKIESPIDRVSSIPYVKKCALIAVYEVIEASPLYPNDTEEWLQPEDWFSDANISAEKYWNEVKQEIENL